MTNLWVVLKIPRFVILFLIDRHPFTTFDVVVMVYLREMLLFDIHQLLAEGFG